VPPGIIGIVLQQFSRCNALLQFFNEDVFILAFTLGVDRELVVFASYLLANKIEDLHIQSIVYRPALFVQKRRRLPVIGGAFTLAGSTGVEPSPSIIGLRRLWHGR
jgi:hypothetical protein